MALRDPSFWFVMRAGTLILAVILQIAFKDKIMKFFANERLKEKLKFYKIKPVQIAVMIVNIVLCSLSFFLGGLVFFH
jgi:hypothetical protein